MATEVKLPSLGDGIDAADVLEIFVSEGQSVTKDQGIMELETDKATVTIPSPIAGKIVKLNVAAGQSVKVGSVYALIEAAAGAAPAPVAAPPKPAATAPAPAPTKVAPPPAPAAAAPVAPTPAKQPVASSSPAPSATNAPATSAPVAASLGNVASREALSPDEGVIPAGPAIRRFAREVGVDLSHVTGTGDGGRITREDVLEVVRQGQQAARSAPSTAISSTGNPSTSSPSKSSVAIPGVASQDDYGPVHIEKMSKIRKTIAAQMHRSWTNVPRVTNFDDADVTDLELFRQSSKDDYAARGIKLTTMPFLIKAVATALRHHPSMNATIDTENEQIIYKDYVNIGIAVDTERGLVVPTLRNADRMSIPEIAQALGDLSIRVRNNDFGVNDLRGGTFTISNLGAIGGTYSTPIVNVPEVAILLVGRTRRMPIVMDDDSIKPRSMMPLSLAYDHRLVDGGTAARFLNDLIMYLEAPSRLLLAI